VRASTAIRSQPPSPTLAWMLTLSGSGGVHSTRLYWMLMRPPSMGAICGAPAAHPRQPPARTASSQASHQLPHELASPSARSIRTAPNQPHAPALPTHKLQRACPGTQGSRQRAGARLLQSSALRPRTLLKVSAWMSMWSVSHSGQTSVMVTVTLRWLGSLLQRPCAQSSATQPYRPAIIHTNAFCL